VIIIRNLASGSITQGQAFADGSFILEIHGFPSDALQVHAADLAGNSSVPLSLAVTASTRELTLISPADGAIVTDRDLTVRGSLRGAEGAGVIVNGVPVNLSAAGDVHTFAARVPLVAGTNTLDIVAHLADGTQLESHRTVTLSNPAPFGIRLSDSHGVAPFTVSFALNEYTSVHAAEVAYDFDSDGKVDDLRVDIGEASSFTYLTAGDHKATVFITAEDGSRYRYEVPITALSRSDIDAQIRPVWHEFLAALSDQATERALRLLLPEFAIRAGPALADLKPALASIVAGLSEAAPGEMSPRLAEYVVTREISGSVHAFLIYFALDANGIWRLASL
jgi:hypothetical protein